MKIFSFAVKYVIAPCGTLLGIYVAIDTWVIGKANTVVEPVRVELHSHIEAGSTTRAFITSSLERLERESIMMRSNQDETNRLLLEISKKAH